MIERPHIGKLLVTMLLENNYCRFFLFFARKNVSKTPKNVPFVRLPDKFLKVTNASDYMCCTKF